MEGAGVITITDAKGTLVHTQDVNIQKGNTIFHMDNLNVAPGMYYIQVVNGNTSTDIVKHSLR
jgi:flagellar hook assembly protein FlgD